MIHASPSCWRSSLEWRYKLDECLHPSGQQRSRACATSPSGSMVPIAPLPDLTRFAKRTTPRRFLRRGRHQRPHAPAPDREPLHPPGSASCWLSCKLSCSSRLAWQEEPHEKTRAAHHWVQICASIWASIYKVNSSGFSVAPALRKPCPQRPKSSHFQGLENSWFSNRSLRLSV
jgi:hypothetical protein